MMPTMSHIDSAISDSYPDAEPYDKLARQFKYLHNKTGKNGTALSDHLDSVVKKNTKHKSFDHYVDDVFKQHKEDSGI